MHSYTHNLTVTSNTLLIYRFVNPSAAVIASGWRGVEGMKPHGMTPRKQPIMVQERTTCVYREARNNYSAELEISL